MLCTVLYTVATVGFLVNFLVCATFACTETFLSLSIFFSSYSHYSHSVTCLGPAASSAAMDAELATGRKRRKIGQRIYDEKEKPVKYRIGTRFARKR